MQLLIPYFQLIQVTLKYKLNLEGDLFSFFLLSYISPVAGGEHECSQAPHLCCIRAHSFRSSLEIRPRWFCHKGKGDGSASSLKRNKAEKFWKLCWVREPSLLRMRMTVGPQPPLSSDFKDVSCKGAWPSSRRTAVPWDWRPGVLRTRVFKHWPAMPWEDGDTGILEELHMRAAVFPLQTVTFEGYSFLLSSRDLFPLPTT